MSRLTLEKALSLFEYDKKNGRLFWKARPLSDFKSARACNVWNGRLVGKEVGSISGGYRCFNIDGESYKTHRVIWFIETGEWPEEVDHDDGDTLNNRFGNLKNGGHAQNMLNKRAYRTNTSGVPGVIWEKGKGLWVARIPVNGKLKTLGRSKDINKVIALRKNAELQLGYNSNHGRAA